MTKKEFMKSLPIELSAFYKAYKQKRKIRDEEMWLMGQYVLSAVSTAVEHCLAGKKAHSKYIEKPILSQENINTKDENSLSQEEKNRQIEQLFMKLEIMGTNHKLNKEKEKGGGE